MSKLSKKLVTIILIGVMSFYSMAPFAASLYAQEASPEPTATEQPTTSSSPAPTEATTSPSATPEPTASPTVQPTENQAIPSSTPVATPKLTSEEEAALKAQAKAEENAQNAREDEWEAHEHDQVWMDAHGGNKDNYISGIWDKQQEELRKQQELEAKKADNSLVLATPDPFAPSPCPVAAPQELIAGASVTNGNANVTNNNCLSAENSDSAQAQTGSNNQSGNDGDAAMSTGNGSATGSQVNQGNTNITNTGSAENLTTANDSQNLKVNNDSTSTTVNNNNDGFVHNELNVEGSSGANTVADNNGNVKLTTGDLELIANMLNILNMNITGTDFVHLIVNIFGQLNGDVDLEHIAKNLGLQNSQELQVIAQNKNTGSDSQNTAEVSKSNTSSIENQNNAEVQNDINVKGTTGGNNVSGNDGNADVTTGRIKIMANILNFINTNFSGEKWKFMMINIFGSLSGNVIVPGTQDYLAQNTKPEIDSTNVEDASSTNTSSINNSNDVKLQNNVYSQGVSGNNQENNNDDKDPSLNTGKTSVLTKIMNMLNFNLSGDNFVLLIVNVFGKWMGKIVGLGATTDAPVNGTLAALAASGQIAPVVTAENTGTGSDSTSSAIASLNSSSSTNNQNSADITNNVNLQGVSGENKLNKNDGKATLITGWVDLTTNLLNIINMNVTGKNWMFVFLNVFGSFNGNLYFGAPPAPEIINTSSNEVDGVANNQSTQSSNENDNNVSSAPIVTLKTKLAMKIRKTTFKKIVKRRIKSSIFHYYAAKNPIINETMASEKNGFLESINKIFDILFGKVKNLQLSLR